MPTERVDWKIPSLKRAIKVARSAGLIVTACEVRKDGTVHIEVCDRVGELPPPEVKASDLTGEAA